jgi:5,10-methylene-tetrahydrofolate dehydrogenase/methenyl tetrahydrofolate cyclohydrolase
MSEEKEEQTEGQRIAEKYRQICNKMTKEEREEAMRRAMLMIYKESEKGHAAYDTVKRYKMSEGEIERAFGINIEVKHLEDSFWKIIDKANNDQK